VLELTLCATFVASQNMTKVIFLCCFYSVIFPASFFFGAVAIAATYLTDKFLLMVRRMNGVCLYVAAKELMAMMLLCIVVYREAGHSSRNLATMSRSSADEYSFR